MQRKVFTNIHALMRSYLLGLSELDVSFSDFKIDHPEKLKELGPLENSVLLEILHVTKAEISYDRTKSAEFTERAIKIVKSLFNVTPDLTNFLVSRTNQNRYNALHMVMEAPLKVLSELLFSVRMAVRDNEITKADYELLHLTAERSTYTPFLSALAFAPTENFEAYLAELFYVQSENLISAKVIQQLFCATFRSNETTLMQVLKTNKTKIQIYFKYLHRAWNDKLISNDDYRQLFMKMNDAAYSVLMNVLTTGKYELISAFCDELKFVLEEKILLSSDLDQLINGVTPRSMNTPLHQAANSPSIMNVSKLIELVESTCSNPGAILGKCLWYRNSKSQLPGENPLQKDPEFLKYTDLLRAKYSPMQRIHFLDRRDRSPQRRPAETDTAVRRMDRRT